MPGRAWLVLGDMAELGSDAEKLHQEMGLLAKDAGVERLYSYGALAAEASKAFGENAICFSSIDELAESIRASADPDINILVKGSRAMRMETVVAKLLDEQDTTTMSQLAQEQ